MAWYVDTSALVKLVVGEPESATLIEWIAARTSSLVSADLARTELLRAARRQAPDLVGRAREVLKAVTLLDVTTEIFEQAALLDPPMLRSLDAVHLASALRLGDELEGLVTYDDRLADAARANAVPVVAPA